MPDKRLVDFLTLEPIEDNIFRGESRNIGTPQVYGGQVLGQSLAAAQATVEGRDVHSVHAYFLRRGDFEAPIIYQVERSRDGRSFASRRVVAIQHGKPIFTMSASFQAQEEGLEFYEKVEQFPEYPEATTSSIEKLIRESDPEQIKLEDPKFRKNQLGFYIAKADQHIDSKTDEPSNASNRWWFRTFEEIGDDKLMQKSIIAYISDAGLIGTAAKPHGYNINDRRGSHKLFMMTSLDHAMWFHRPFRVDEWLLYESTAVSTGNGRGLVRGNIYSRDGALVVSCIQEGVVRKK